VWLDCFTFNVDRTARNTNLLVWHNELWLIDHGAALYLHHTGPAWASATSRSFPQVRDHVLLPQATALQEADAQAHQLLGPLQLQEVVDLIPDEWLLTADPELEPAAHRQQYHTFLATRLANSATFVAEATNARLARI